MLKKIFIFIFLFVCLYAQAQNISVESFRLDEMDLTANQQGTTVMDQNGEKCALIKVKTTETGFTFDVGSLGVQKTTQKTAEIWVYVPHGIRKFNVSHQKYGSVEYSIPVSIDRARTYICQLKAETPLPVNHQRLSIKCTPSDAVVLIDGEVIEENPITLPLGTHKYTVAAKGFISQSGSVELNENGPGKLIIELDRKEQSQLMPQPSSENEGTTNITLTPEEVELRNTFNEIFDAISDWLDIKPGRTNLQELSGKYNVRINHNEGFNSCELINEETTITCFDYDKDGVVDYVDLTLFKEGLSEIHLMQQDKRFPDFFDGISFNSNYNEWNQWFVSKGLRYQKYNRENPALIFTFRINKKLKNINIVFRPLKSPDKTTLSGIGIGMSE